MTLAALHQAGADVAGPHGDAWLRMRIDPGRIDQIAAAHARLGRRVIPADLTGQPVPLCAGGEHPPEKTPTPGQREYADIRPLDDAQRDRLRAAIVASSGDAFAKHAECSPVAVSRALAGETITPRIRERIVAALDQPMSVVADTRAANPVVSHETAIHATQAKEPAMSFPATDPLLEKLNAEISKRGRGAAKAMAQAFGLHPTCAHTWNKDGGVPLGRRAQVEAWIAGQPIPEPLHVRARRQDVPRVVAKLPDPAPVAPEPPKAAGSTGGAILAALSGVAVRGWVVVDGEMVERRVVVI